MESLQERLRKLKGSKPVSGDTIDKVWDWSMRLAELQLAILEEALK